MFTPSEKYPRRRFAAAIVNVKYNTFGLVYRSCTRTIQFQTGQETLNMKPLNFTWTDKHEKLSGELHNRLF